MAPQNIRSSLLLLEKKAGNDPAKLAELEQIYETGAKERPCDFCLLRQRNQFRIRHIGAMRIRRPRMLFGGRTFTDLNFQSLPAIRNADTVFISFQSTENDPATPDVVPLDPFTATMKQLLKKLPVGFMPDFYFNYQVCTCSDLLPGLDAAPFPTVANICHMFMAHSCLEISRLFDFVLPVSPALSEVLKKNVNPEKIINISHGLAWGHFQDTITPDKTVKRDIDVLLSFTPNPDSPLFGNTRNTVHRLFHEAEARLGQRYNFVYPGSIPKDEYISLLKRSRIVLNAVGINGPYNYRTSEAIAAGALLMQLEPDYISGPQHMDAYLSPDKEYVSFGEEDFLTKLETLLADEPRRAKIAQSGAERMGREHSYDALYAKLFAELRPRLQSSEWRTRRISPEQALLARTGNQFQLLCVPGMRAPGQVSLCQEDLNALLSGKIGDPYALLLAAYPRLSPALRHILTNGKSDQNNTSTEEQNKVHLQICQKLLHLIQKPSIVDIFNFDITSAKYGKLEISITKYLLEMLDTQTIHLSHSEILRVNTLPRFDGLSKDAEWRYRIQIYNFPALFSSDPEDHIAATKDYMRVILFEVMKLAEPENRELWQKKCDDLLVSYPVEGPAPAYASAKPAAAAE